MKTPTLSDVVADIYDQIDNDNTLDTEFGDSDNTNVTIPTITDLTGTVSYYDAEITHAPFAKIEWSWSRPLMYDEDGNVVDHSDPEIADDINLDPVVDYMFGESVNGSDPTYRSTNNSTTISTTGHALNVNVKSHVYAVLKSGITGPVTTYEAVVEKDTTAPNPPSAPVLVSAMSVVTVTEDGLDNTGGTFPNDYQRTEIVVGTTNPPTQIIGQIYGAGSYSFGATPGDTIYVQTFAYDYSGNKSAGSTIASVLVKSVLDDTDLTSVLNAKASIYQQNADPVTTEPSVNDGSWWYKCSATNPLEIINIYHRVTGAWVEDAINASQVIAALSIVAGLLDVDSVVASNIKAGELYSKLSTTHELLADVIQTGTLAAAVTISGLLQTAQSGKRVIINSDGIRLIKSDGVSVMVNIPTDDTTEASFNGKVNAVGLSVSGRASFASDKNSINSGAKLILEDQITAPATGPNMSVSYETAEYTDTSYLGFNPLKYLGAGNGYVVAVQSGSYPNYVYTIHQLDEGGTSVKSAELTGAAIGTGITKNSNLAIIGDYLYVLSGTNIVNKFYWDGVNDGQFVSSFTLTGGDGYWGIGTDGTYLLYCYRAPVVEDGRTYYRPVIKKVDVSTETVVSTYTVAISIGTVGTVNHISGGSAYPGYAGTNLYLFTASTYVSGSSQVVAYLYNPATGVIVDKWPISINSGLATTFNVGALGYDGTSWFVTDASNLRKIRYNGIAIGSSISVPIYSGYTLYDSSTAGGTATHESAVSPESALNVNRYSKLTISVPDFESDVSTNDSVDQVKIYAGTVSGTLKLQGASSTGFVDIDVLDTGSAAAPTVSTFPAGTPGSIENADGSLVISANGDITMKNGTFSEQLKNADGTASINADGSVEAAAGEFGVDANGVVTSKLVKAKMMKTNSGPTYSANTWTQVTGFGTSYPTYGVTMDAANGKFTILSDGSYDLLFHGRWQNYGSVNSRSLAIVKGTSAPATDASNVISQVTISQDNWLINDVIALAHDLVTGDVVTFWIRSSAGSTFNASNTAIPGWTFASIVKR